MLGAAVECAGVAYYCRASLSTISQLGAVGSKTTLYTYMHIRSESLELFGFADQAELNCFKMLISVTGVGPKVGLSILSVISPERFALCVASGDHKCLTAAPGVGTKLAQRIVLELKDKVAKGGMMTDFVGGAAAPVSSKAGGTGEAMSALLVLGYTPAEAGAAIGKLDPALSVEELIKGSLKLLAKGG